TAAYATELCAPQHVALPIKFEVSWSETLDGYDFIGLVPEGAGEQRPKPGTRVGSRSSVRLTAPAEPGRYEVRYALVKGHKTMGSTTLEVTEADDIGISAPDQDV